MKSLLISEVFLCLLVLTAAIPKPEDEHKQRDVHKDISGHYINNQHNPAYDHEAFLGEDAKTFDQLPHEESSRRLGLIVDKIDKDKDGFVTKEELKDWILYVQQQYIHKNVDKQWQSHNPEDKPKLSWTEYRNMVYGSIQETENDVPNKSEEDSFSYATMLKRDRRRWSIADLDGDDALTKEEFTAFLHAEEAPHMKDVVALETMEDIDKDGDGKLSLEEYIGDMYIPNDGIDDPEWVKNEREQFTSFRDKDGDGFMDIKEVKEWVTPSDYDHAEAESRHLIFEADMDADQKLTKEEILENYNIFVGSPATDFGEALTRHDEF